MPGKFIVFEGGEGSGKSTQIKRAAEWIRSSEWGDRLSQELKIEDPVVVTREPGGTQLGQHIRKLILDPSLSKVEEITPEAELFLCAADRAQHVIQCIKPHLEAGRIVLCDRFTASTVAYQGYGRGLDLELIKQINQLSTCGLRSDLTLWLDVDASVGLARARGRSSEYAKGDRMEANDLAFHQRIRKGFAEVAKQDHQVRVIDANKPLEEVNRQIDDALSHSFRYWYREVFEEN